MFVFCQQTDTSSPITFLAEVINLIGLIQACNHEHYLRE